MAATINKLVKTVAEVRGMNATTVEAYARPLRREGIFPETRVGRGTIPATTQDAAHLLFAVMRGSPGNAAENAREVGGLIAFEGGLLRPVLNWHLSALALHEGGSFAEAVGSLIERFADGTISDVLEPGTDIEIRIDRYWTNAKLRWTPLKSQMKSYTDCWRGALNIDPPRSPGHATVIAELEFLSPLRHEMHVSYGVDPERNRRAGRKFTKARDEASRFDVHGTESIYSRTLIAISELFKQT